MALQAGFDQLAIANGALAKLGNSPALSSLTDDTKHAELCLRFLDPAIDQTLEAFNWRWCAKRVEIDPVSTTPDAGGFYQFTYPTDFRREIGIWSGAVRELREDCRQVAYRSENAFYAATDKVTMLYVSRPTSFVYATGAFIDAVTAKLAHLIALPVTQSPVARDDMERAFFRALEMALSVNTADANAGGQVGPMGPGVVPTLIAARTAD